MGTNGANSPVVMICEPCASTTTKSARTRSTGRFVRAECTDIEIMAAIHHQADRCLRCSRTGLPLLPYTIEVTVRG